MTNPEEHWNSAAIPPQKQFTGFQEIFDRTHFHWDLKSQCDGGYSASIRRRRFDNYVFTNIIADPMAGFRRVEDVKRDRDEYFCLLFFDGGRCSLSQGRNESLVQANTISLWDSTRPAMFANAEPIAQNSILIPHRDAKTIVPGIEDMCGLVVDGSAGLGAILLSHLRQIHSTIDTVPPEDRPAVLRATVELLAATFRPKLDHTASTTFRQALLNRVQDYIVANLSEPTLSPASIAAAFRFSPRYLHRLFEEFDVTVGEWIRRRRLINARADLTAAGQRSLSVTEIAMRHGFADASHFSHAFKAAFGMGPRDFRKAHRETLDA